MFECPIALESLMTGHQKDLKNVSVSFKRTYEPQSSVRR